MVTKSYRQKIFSEREHQFTIKEMLEIVIDLPNENLKKEIGLSVITYFLQAELLAYHLGIEDLLIDILTKKILKLKRINKKIL